MPASEELGAAIRARREAQRPKLSQEALGQRAGYGKGAGVAISRIESGQIHPSPRSLDGIAHALGTTSEALKEEARRRAADDAGARTPPSGLEESAKRRTLRDRLRDVEETVEHRTEVATQRAETFNEAHDRARDEFFLPFVEKAERIKGAPTPPEPRELSEEEQADPASRAEYHVRISSAIVARAVGGAGGAAAGVAAGGAAAYATFTAAAMFGTASTGAAISGLSGVAATNATLAFLGGGALTAGGLGMAGGTAVLAGIVAAPVALLGVAGFLLMARWSKRKQAELRVKLDEAEAEIRASQEGFDAFTDLVPQATAVLEYIGVHASHALDRWSVKLGTLPIDWSDMDADQQQRYGDFLTIAGCQLTVAGLNLGALLSLRDEVELAELAESIAQDLRHAKDKVEALV